jgi:hypothetical protein
MTEYKILIPGGYPAELRWWEETLSKRFGGWYAHKVEGAEQYPDVTAAYFAYYVAIPTTFAATADILLCIKVALTKFHQREIYYTVSSTEARKYGD